MSIERVNPPDLAKPAGFSHAVVGTGTTVFLAVIAGLAVLMPILHLLPAEGSALQFSTYTMTLLGK